MYKSHGKLRKAGGWESIMELLQRLAPFSVLPSLMAAVGRQNLDVDQYGCSQILCGEFLLSWQ